MLPQGNALHIFDLLHIYLINYFVFGYIQMGPIAFEMSNVTRFKRSAMYFEW